MKIQSCPFSMFDRRHILREWVRRELERVEREQVPFSSETEYEALLRALFERLRPRQHLLARAGVVHREAVLAHQRGHADEQPSAADV